MCVVVPRPQDCYTHVQEAMWTSNANDLSNTMIMRPWFCHGMINEEGYLMVRE